MEKFSGANFCFWVVVLVLCFWWVFAIVFVLFFGVSLPKLFGKILLMSGLVFSGFVLSSLGFSPTSFVVFFSKRQRSGSHRTPPHTHLSCWFLFLICVPPLLSVSPVLAVRPASRRFSRGAILGPARFWDSP